MAGQDRGPFSDLKLDLLKESRAFSFFQVIRLLRLFHEPSADRTAHHSDRITHLRIRPKLSLAFPPADVDSIEEQEVDDERLFLVTATLLGLYGTSSPLPTFYTEDLMDEQAAEESVSRDFLDIINQRLLILLFECWNKYRLFLQVLEEKSEACLVRLFSLIGLGEKALRKDVDNAYGLLRYLGLFTQFPRSSMGLECLLQDALGNVPVQVVPCVPRKASIPADQRALLGRSGCVLGKDCFIGREVDDRMGKFRLRIGPVDGDRFQKLLPQGKGHKELAFLTRFYASDVLAYDVEMRLLAGQGRCACLGGAQWSRLGLDTWVFSEETLGEVSVRF